MEVKNNKKQRTECGVDIDKNDMDINLAGERILLFRK